MSARLYVGNISYLATEQELRDAFAAHGQVTQVNIVLDRETRRPRGFAFVEMDNAGAQKAVEQMDGTVLGGRRITVGPARERAARPREDFRVDRDRKRDWS